MVVTLKPLAIFLLSIAPIVALAQNPSTNCAAEAVAPSRSQSSGSAPEQRLKVNRVIFTGSPVLSALEQEEISTGFSKSTYKTLQDARDDLKARVTHQWQQRGYFKVVVGEPEIRPDVNDPSSSVATVRVDAGKQYRLAELRFVRNTVFASERLRALFSMQTGDIFDTHLIGKGIESMRDLYGAEGYINVTTVPTTQLDEDRDKVDLTLEMDEGKQFRVGRVEVLGSDEATRRQFISGSGLITGNIFNPLLLQKAFASSGKDGSESMQGPVVRTINEADSTVDFKVDLAPCVSVSRK